MHRSRWGDDVSHWDVHSLEGRLRIRVPGIRSCAAQALVLEQQLAGLSGIELVRANPVTGNVLIRYDSNRISQRHILRVFRRLGWLSPEQAQRSAPDAAPAPQVGDTVGHRILEKVVTALLEIVFLRLLRLA